uniref:Uncharacterized protein n=1 Tax=Solanum tuberosum TaxID=4113 RepID=M1DWL5_SOLTU
MDPQPWTVNTMKARWYGRCSRSSRPCWVTNQWTRPKERGSVHVLWLASVRWHQKPPENFYHGPSHVRGFPLSPPWDHSSLNEIEDITKEKDSKLATPHASNFIKKHTTKKEYRLQARIFLKPHKEDSN